MGLPEPHCTYCMKSGAETDEHICVFLFLFQLCHSDVVALNLARSPALHHSSLHAAARAGIPQGLMGSNHSSDFQLLGLLPSSNKSGVWIWFWQSFLSGN